MSGQLRVDQITDELGTGSPAFPNGLETTALNGLAYPDASSMGFRNRIINGDMRIDQRNAGAAVTQATSTIYVVDRFSVNGSPTPKLTIQQNAGSVTPPTGFVSYLGITSSSAYTVTGNESFLVTQIIEGFNVADLDWGSASAKPATLSFWVRSSLTGVFGGSIATTKTATWVMPFSYTISDANTWTYVTVAIPAATSTGGTNNNNSAGVFVRFGLGATGTSAGGTAGSWQAGNFVQPSGTVSVVGTNGATFYITGVQLEAGSVATPFERRPYGTELALCQRYLPAFVGNDNMVCNGSGFDANNTRLRVSFPVQVRAPATGIVVSSAAHFSIQTGSGSLTACASLSFASSGVNGAAISSNHSGGGATNAGTALFSNNASAILYFTGCEL
jgi:hypothetical protein